MALIKESKNLVLNFGHPSDGKSDKQRKLDYEALKDALAECSSFLSVMMVLVEKDWTVMKQSLSSNTASLKISMDGHFWLSVSIDKRQEPVTFTFDSKAK